MVSALLRPQAKSAFAQSLFAAPKSPAPDLSQHHGRLAGFLARSSRVASAQHQRKVNSGVFGKVSCRLKAGRQP